jgi:hypothetical protein
MLVTPAASAKMKSLREIRALAKQVAMRYNAFKDRHPSVEAKIAARRSHSAAIVTLTAAQRAHLEAFGGGALPMYTAQGTKR